MHNLALQISHTLRALRAERGWSLDTTSRHTGVSKAMLGQIERNESSPTIATLWKIASGFNVAFSSFIEDASTQVNTLHRRGDLKHMHPSDKNIRILPLFTYDKKLDFEVFIIELQPGYEHLSPPHQSNVIEHIIVSSGEIEVLTNNIWHPVKEHEGFRFHADTPHGYRNVSSSPAILHDMIHYPRN